MDGIGSASIELYQLETKKKKKSSRLGAPIDEAKSKSIHILPKQL